MIIKNFVVSHQHHAKKCKKKMNIIQKYIAYESKMFLSVFHSILTKLVLCYSLIKETSPYTQKVQIFKGAAPPQTKKGKNVHKTLRKQNKSPFKPKEGHTALASLVNLPKISQDEVSNIILHISNKM